MDADLTDAHRFRLYHRLQLAARRAQRAADRELLAAAGVTTAQAAVLAVLASEGTATQRAVAESLGLHESAITQMVPRLLESGLVGRNRSEVDVRAWELSLTDVGRSAVDALGNAFANVNAVFEDALATTDIADLARDLERISDAFDTRSDTT